MTNLIKDRRVCWRATPNSIITLWANRTHLVLWAQIVLNERLITISPLLEAKEQPRATVNWIIQSASKPSIHIKSIWKPRKTSMTKLLICLRRIWLWCRIRARWRIILISSNNSMIQTTRATSHTQTLLTFPFRANLQILSSLRSQHWTQRLPTLTSLISTTLELENRGSQSTS